MIFQETYQQVLDGTKTQTRRPVKPGEECHDKRTVSRHWISRFRFMAPGLDWTYMYPKYQIGKDYAVQPGRGKKAVGRIRITKIRRERLQEITLLDLRAEMGPTKFVSFALFRPFKALWNSLYRKPYTWEDNPEVWVLEFEKEEENGEVVGER